MEHCKSFPFQPEDTMIGQTHQHLQKDQTPKKRSKTETRRNQKKFCKSRRMNGGHFIPTKVVKPIFTQLPTLVTMPPAPQAATAGTGIFVQLPNKMAQAQPEIGQSQQIQNFCPVGRKCPKN